MSDHRSHPHRRSWRLRIWVEGGATCRLLPQTYKTREGALKAGLKLMEEDRVYQYEAIWQPGKD